MEPKKRICRLHGGEEVVTCPECKDAWKKIRRVCNARNKGLPEDSLKEPLEEYLKGTQPQHSLREKDN